VTQICHIDRLNLVLLLHGKHVFIWHCFAVCLFFHYIFDPIGNPCRLSALDVDAMKGRVAMPHIGSIAESDRGILFIHDNSAEAMGRIFLLKKKKFDNERTVYCYRYECRNFDFNSKLHKLLGSDHNGLFSLIQVSHSYLIHSFANIRFFLHDYRIRNTTSILLLTTWFIMKAVYFSRLEQILGV
jgi:hypothetical protein